MVNYRKQGLEIIYTPKYLNYFFGNKHPFWPQRASVFLEMVKRNQTFKFDYQIITPKRCSDQDVLLVHTKDYLKRVKKLAKIQSSLSLDTPVSQGNLDAAYYYVGGTLVGAELALSGCKAINLLGGLHHAGISDASGFCIFNDHAIAIKKLQKNKKIKKAAILDIDVHAGNGTSEIFYTDASVLKISIHQDPTFFYPGTGFSWQKGEGEGKGFNCNFPLPAGTGERTYLKVFDSALEKLKLFTADINFLILGVDTYKKDPLALFNLDIESYRKIGKRLKDIKNLVILCAGGYSLDTPNLWLSFLKGYIGN